MSDTPKRSIMIPVRCESLDGLTGVREIEATLNEDGTIDYPLRFTVELLDQSYSSEMNTRTVGTREYSREWVFNSPYTISYKERP